MPFSLDPVWRAGASSVLCPQPATPVVAVGMKVASKTFPVLLKLEGRSPAGSTKGRTARSLLRGLLHHGRLDPGSHVIESSSGNLAFALALYASELGIPFTAVIDPKTTVEIRSLLATTSARVEVVRVPDGEGSYLSARRRRVRELFDTLPGAVWTNQYSSLDNPLAHYTETAPEIIDQCPSRPDFVFAALSTGGTASGLADRLAELSPTTTVVAVDVEGSAATGGESGPRLLTGIGSSRLIEFPLGDNVVVSRVSDRQAFAHSRRLREDTGIDVGGSSGATLAACARFLATVSHDVTVLCLCADGADRYESTIFSDRWLADHGVVITDADLLPAVGYLPAEIGHHGSIIPFP